MADVALEKTITNQIVAWLKDSGFGFDLADVRRVISEATRVDEKLYQVHKGIERRWSKRSAAGGEQ